MFQRRCTPLSAAASARHELLLLQLLGGQVEHPRPALDARGGAPSDDCVTRALRLALGFYHGHGAAQWTGGLCPLCRRSTRFGCC
jgi:hypothetical protein